MCLILWPTPWGGIGASAGAKPGAMPAAKNPAERLRRVSPCMTDPTLETFFCGDGAEADRRGQRSVLVVVTDRVVHKAKRYALSRSVRRISECAGLLPYVG